MITQSVMGFRFRSLLFGTVLATLLVGLIAGLLVNLVVGQLVHKAFQAQLVEELEDEALKGRAAFDEFVKLHYELTKVITEQARFVHYVEALSMQGTFESQGEALRHKRQPKWLPRRSTLRRFAQAGIYVLLDRQGRAIEFYDHSHSAMPIQLLSPPATLLLAARNENFITAFDDIPYVVSSAPVETGGLLVGHLLLATAIDDALLATLRPAGAKADKVALVAGHDHQVIATSDNDAVPKGSVLAQYQTDYFVFSAPVYNYEYSDLIVSYANFVERAVADQLAEPIIARERLYQTLAALLLVGAFGLIVLNLARRVQQVIDQVSTFSRDALGVDAPVSRKGDQLAELASLLTWLAGEVEAANREQASLRRAILDAIPMPLFYTDTAGHLLGCNRAYEAFAGQSRDQLIGKLQAEVLDSNEENYPDELEMVDYTGVRHVFLIGRARFENRDDHVAGWVTTMADITENRRAADQIQALNQDLEARVMKRTAELQASLDDLRLTQDRLVEAEKMASLGELVAGVAHEINTPVGIGVTAASHLQESADQIIEAMEHGLRRSQLSAFVDTVKLSSDTIVHNLLRAAELIRGFKEVAVDRSSEQRRRFELCSYLTEVLNSLRPKIKHTPWRVDLHCTGQIAMDSYPGALAQVITNLFMNALIHGFEGRDEGLFLIEVELPGNNEVVLRISDDGNGMSINESIRIFDPFYTTKRGRGGSGLGLNIVYNQVTGVMGGRIEYVTEPGLGTRFTIHLPQSPAEASDDE